MKKILTVLAVAAILTGHAGAADNSWLVDFAALDPLIGKPTEVSALRISIPNGRNANISGLDLGFWGRSERAWGLQINLLLNDAKEKMGGAQFGGCNLSEETAGLQCGLWNDATTMVGLQIGGLNYMENGNFLQCGLGNQAETFKGIQIGLWNMTPVFTGMQLGLCNLSQTCEGYQIGLINKTDRMKGFQLGLINIITASELPVAPLVNCLL
jgi:hypothetical protein